MKQYPVPSEQQLRELRKQLQITITAKKYADLILRVNLPIPPGMDNGSYTEMNITSGQRAGFTRKQECLTKLGDMYAEGYLTGQEYDKRCNWVNDAQTSEQLKIVFTDLQDALSSMKTDPAPEEPTIMPWILYTIPITLTSLVLGVVFNGSDAWIPAIPMLVSAVITALIILKIR